MILTVLLISIVLVFLAGIALGVKYYKEKKTPSCSAVKDGSETNEDNDCDVCGASTGEACKK